MRVESLHAFNFRSLRDVEVTFGGLTVLIGANSSGKTSVLEALRLFGSERTEVGKEDFFSTDDPIEVTLILDPGKNHSIPAEFLPDGKIAAQKVFELSSNGPPKEIMRIKKMCSKDFLDARNAPTARDRQSKMKDLAKDRDGFPAPRAEWPGALDAYERDHMNDPATRSRYGWHFVPFEQGPVTADDLLTAMYVPAMHDIPADAEDDGHSVLGELLDITARGSKAHDAEVKRILDAADKKILRSMASLDSGAAALSRQMSARIKTYVDGTSVSIKFRMAALKNSRPRATFALMEDGLRISMARAGSGLQRICLMVLLEALYETRGGGDQAAAPGADPGGDQAAAPGADPGGDQAAAPGAGAGARLLLIDEPELYQHPQRQHRILRALGHLACSSPIQVVCSTHSPYFVRFDGIERTRRFRKEGKKTHVSATTLGDIVASLNKMELRHEPFDPEMFVAWLDMVASHWIVEGLFSRLAVFVEGPGDRNMLLATARAMGINLADYEASIIPCGSKNNMPHIVQIFRHLGIPTYMVWDMDAKNKSLHNSKINDALLRLACGRIPDGSGHRGAECTDTHTRLATDLSDATVSMLENPDMLLTERMNHYGIYSKRKDAKKGAAHNQRIMYEILGSIRGDAQRFSSLPTVRIIRQITARAECARPGQHEAFAET